jgi:hypothetical protein
VNTVRAFVAGVVGTVVMSLIMISLRAIALPLHIEHRLGASVGLGAWVPGLIIFLIIGGVLALVYAAIFEWVLNQAGVGAGLLLGACNAVFAGFFWAQMSGPGPFWDRLGIEGIGALFFVHFVYGAVVGGLYRTRHTLAYF